MNQNASQEEHLEELLMSLKFMDVIPSHGSPVFSNMLDILAQHINELIESDFNMLLSILYRIDVDENKIRSELKKTGENKTAGHIIALLIIERQKEKLKWKKI